MHHLGNFSISRVGERVGPARAPPRRALVAPPSIIPPSLSAESVRPARGAGGGGRIITAARAPRLTILLKDFRLNTALTGYIINLLPASCADEVIPRFLPRRGRRRKVTRAPAREASKAKGVRLTRSTNFCSRL